MDYTPAVLADHARALARAFSIRLIEDPELASKPECAISLRLTAKIVAEQRLPLSAVGEQVVFCAPIIEELTYIIALHEEGHRIAPCGDLTDEIQRSLSLTRKANLSLLQEDAAWEWARRNALIWTPAMEVCVKDYAYQTHVDTTNLVKQIDRMFGASL